MNNTMKNEEKNVLHDVHISKNDTCLTYVLKRLGLPPTSPCTINFNTTHLYPKKN